MDLPHRVQHVRLPELHLNEAAAQLVARVPAVPVVVLGIAVEQVAPTSTHSFDQDRAHLQRRHIMLRHCKHNTHCQSRKPPPSSPGPSNNFSSVLTDESPIQSHSRFRIHRLERDNVEYFIDRVIGSDDADIEYDPTVEVQMLPGAAVIRRVVDHANPVLLVHRNLNVVRIRPAKGFTSLFKLPRRTTNLRSLSGAVAGLS